MTRAELQRQKIRGMLAGGGVVRWSDLRQEGIDRRALIGMLDSGELVRCDRDVYRLAAAPTPKHAHWGEISAKYDDFVICLLSAAQFHGLTTQMPPETWVGLPTGSKPSNARLRCVQWPLVDETGQRHRLWELGVETVEADGGFYRVTSPARTVVDLYRWKGRLEDGKRVFFEALNEYDRRGMDRATLRKVGKEFGVNQAISELLTARSEFTSAY